MNTLDILVADANKGDIRLLQEMLSSSNIDHSLDVCNDGENAILKLDSVVKGKRRMPDVFLLEVNLPKHDGIKVLTHAKAHQELILLPVIILSSSLNPLDIKRAYKAKANGFIIKPFHLEEYRVFVEDLQKFCSISPKYENCVFESQFNKLPPLNI